jgi:hypothetical protein
MIAILEKFDFADETVEEVSPLSKHAAQRMHARGISNRDIENTMTYGRVSHVRGATYYTIGKREIRHYRRRGIDLHKHHGVHVVCSRSGKIMTVYRNTDLRDLKPRSRYETFDRRAEFSMRASLLQAIP